MKYRKLLFKYTPKGEKSIHIGELLDLFYVPDGFFTGGEVDYYDIGCNHPIGGEIANVVADIYDVHRMFDIVEVDSLDGIKKHTYRAHFKQVRSDYYYGYYVGIYPFMQLKDKPWLCLALAYGESRGGLQETAFTGFMVLRVIPVASIFHMVPEKQHKDLRYLFNGEKLEPVEVEWKDTLQGFREFISTQTLFSSEEQVHGVTFPKILVDKYGSLVDIERVDTYKYSTLCIDFDGIKTIGTLARYGDCSKLKVIGINTEELPPQEMYRLPFNLCRLIDFNSDKQEKLERMIEAINLNHSKYPKERQKEFLLFNARTALEHSTKYVNLRRGLAEGTIYQVVYNSKLDDLYGAVCKDLYIINDTEIDSRDRVNITLVDYIGGPKSENRSITTSMRGYQVLGILNREQFEENRELYGLLLFSKAYED